MPWVRHTNGAWQRSDHVADKHAFFYPTHNDPVHRYLWGERPTLRERAMRLAKNLLRLAAEPFGGRRDAIRQAYYRTFHALRGSEWHYRRACQSYCLHLWEGLWGEPYLQAVTPDYLRASSSNFARLLRRLASADFLDAIAPAGRRTRCAPTGKEHVDVAVVEKLRQWLDPKLRTRLLRDTRMVTGWIYEVIKQVCADSVGAA